MVGSLYRVVSKRVRVPLPWDFYSPMGETEAMTSVNSSLFLSLVINSVEAMNSDSGSE